MYEPRTTPHGHREPSFSGIFSRTFLLILLATLLVVTLGRSFLGGGPLLDPDAEPRIVTPRGDLAQDERSTIALFEAAAPSVVHIATRAVRRTRDPFLPRWFETAEGTGSGFVWDEDGHVVTNYHVVRSGNAWTVRLQDGSEWKADFVGGAPDYDLAVLRVDAARGKLRPTPIGTSSDLLVGQKVFAIGNPFGLDHTLTTGVISGLDRSIMSVGELPIRGVVQTDAAINPGNSGGPLLDSAGRLIGVNTAIASPSGAYAGVGFAVPVDTVNRVVPRILREGNPPRAGLGVSLLDGEMGDALGLQGVAFSYVYPDSSAERAGLRPTVVRRGGTVELGDLIVSVEGEAVRTGQDLVSLLQAYEVGDEVRLGVVRPGESGVEQLVVRLQRLPEPVR